AFLDILAGVSFLFLFLGKFYTNLHGLVAKIFAAVCLVALFVLVVVGDTVKLFVSIMLLASCFKLLPAKTVKQYQTVCIQVVFNL
ncbi:hypothetical protein CWB79_22600, partial [Pseudoalteromonas sp. S1649]